MFSLDARLRDHFLLELERVSCLKLPASKPAPVAILLPAPSFQDLAAGETRSNPNFKTLDVIHCNHISRQESYFPPWFLSGARPPLEQQVPGMRGRGEYRDGSRGRRGERERLAGKAVGIPSI